jgi:AcrR family transcriptional regulator
VSALSAKDTAKRAKAEAYRRLIADAAQRVFAEHGFEAAKIQDIAQGAGLSLGTLYSVFPGKNEIYVAIRALHGQQVVREVGEALSGQQNALEATLRGIDSYVRCLVRRPYYLRMILREGLSWTQRSWLRTGEEIATWEQGLTLAVALLRAGIERGLLYGDNSPDVLLKMMIASQQVQLLDWVERGADGAEIDALIARMQDHFRRAYVRTDAPAVQGNASATSARGHTLVRSRARQAASR